MNDTEWFQGSPLNAPEARHDRRLLVPRLIVLIVLGALGMALLLGCAAVPEDEEVWHRICYEQPIGRADNGLTVVRHFCVREGDRI